MARLLPALILGLSLAACSSSTAPSTSTKSINVTGNLSFGNVTVGQSVTLPFTIQNTGSASLVVSGMGGLPCGSAFAESFTSGTIAAGASQQVQLTFHPTDFQDCSGVLTVIADQKSGQNKINVGAAGAPSGGSSYTISGVVAENGQPIANAAVNAGVSIGDSSYSYWYAHGPQYTDASGRYRLTSLPGGAQVWVQLSKDGYSQPCAAWAIISGDLTMDLALVSRANLTASPMPSAPGFRSVSGTVVEMTATGLQPVVGAIVVAGQGPPNISFRPSEDWAADTYSDAAGRFALCGLPANDTVALEALLGSASAEVSVAPGQISDIQITLPSSMSNTGSMMALRPRLARR